MSQRTPQIFYSEKYTDDKYEYRHVVLPKDMVKLLPTSRLMTEREWRSIGVQQSPGWIHYMVHMPEPWILLFKRPLSTTAEPTAPIKTETKTTVASNITTTTDTTTTRATTKAQPPKEKDKKAN